MLKNEQPMKSKYLKIMLAIFSFLAVGSCDEVPDRVYSYYAYASYEYNGIPKQATFYHTEFNGGGLKFEFKSAQDNWEFTFMLEEITEDSIFFDAHSANEYFLKINNQFNYSRFNNAEESYAVITRNPNNFGFVFSAKITFELNGNSNTILVKETSINGNRNSGQSYYFGNYFYNTLNTANITPIVGTNENFSLLVEQIGDQQYHSTSSLSFGYNGDWNGAFFTLLMQNLPELEVGDEFFIGASQFNRFSLRGSAYTMETGPHAPKITIENQYQEGSYRVFEARLSGRFRKDNEVIELNLPFKKYQDE